MKNEDDPLGECLTCRRITGNTLKRTPCLRRKITETTFSPEKPEPAQYWSWRWKTWEIKDVENWASQEIRTITTTQDVGSATDTYHVRLVVPMEGDSMSRTWLSKSTGTRLYHPVTPYAIVNMAEAAERIRQNCNDHISVMMSHYLKGCDAFVRETYSVAHQYSTDPSVKVKPPESQMRCIL